MISATFLVAIGAHVFVVSWLLGVFPGLQRRRRLVIGVSTALFLTAPIGRLFGALHLKDVATSLSAAGTTDGTVPIGTVYGFEEKQGTNYLFYQWYKNGVAIPGANGPSITLGPLQASDNGATIYCQMRALGYADASLNPIWSNSLTATLTLRPIKA